MSDLLKTAAWQRLVSAAKDHTQLTTKETGQALSDAAKLWAVACAPSPSTPGRVVGTRGNTLRSGQVVPFGRSKGQPVEECDDRDLEWLQKAMRESVDDPSKERWREKNQALLDAIDAELDSRGQGDDPMSNDIDTLHPGHPSNHGDR